MKYLPEICGCKLLSLWGLSVRAGNVCEQCELKTLLHLLTYNLLCLSIFTKRLHNCKCANKMLKKMNVHNYLTITDKDMIITCIWWTCVLYNIIVVSCFLVQSSLFVGVHFSSSTPFFFIAFLIAIHEWREDTVIIEIFRFSHVHCYTLSPFFLFFLIFVLSFFHFKSSLLRYVEHWRGFSVYDIHCYASSLPFPFCFFCWRGLSSFITKRDGVLLSHAQL